MKPVKRNFLRLGCGILASVMVSLTPLSVPAETLEEIRDQQEQLQAENQKLQSKLDSLREDESQKQEYQITLQDQIDVVQKQILTTRDNIADLNESIQELSMKLDASQATIQDTIDQFKDRLVALYTAGNVSTLEILLDSASLSDFTTRMELLNNMTSHDQALIDKLETYIESTQEDREKVQTEKEQVAQLQITLEQKEEELDDLYQENRAALGEIQGQLYATEDQMKVNEEELAQGEARIQAAIEAKKKEEEEAKKQQIIQQQTEQSQTEQPQTEPQQTEPSLEEPQQPVQDNTPSPEEPSTVVSPTTPPSEPDPSGFHCTWPLPGVTYVSYGWNGYPGHKGMDIAGPWGTPIVAAADGQVIEANSTDSWGYSWGYYVLIYHNGTYSTRYAHMSSVAVSTGQYVTAGTIIGYEGETGNAFGAHLHFEVYENGTRVDPAQFL